jgi:hypothetical protein
MSQLSCFIIIFMYAMVYTRLDIDQVVQVVNQFMANLGKFVGLQWN